MSAIARHASPCLALSVALAAALATGCAHSAAPASASTAPAPAATDQVALGQQLYGEHCATCHGDAGEGGKKAPPVVGAAALPLDPRPDARARTSKFHTALDVALFVKDNMPPKKAGSLTLAQYFAILAFDLKANGVDVTGKTIDVESARAIVLHP